MNVVLLMRHDTIDQLLLSVSIFRNLPYMVIDKIIITVHMYSFTVCVLRVLWLLI